MYAWPDMYGYDPLMLQQYGYGYPDMAAQQFGFGRHRFFRPFFPFFPFFFFPFFFHRHRWWW